MLSLILETSTSNGLIVLSNKNNSMSYKFFNASFNFSKNLMPAIHSILEENGLSPKQLCYIATGFGPGSYTGVRIGASVSKTFSFALNVPLIGFCSILAFLPKTAYGNFAFVSDAKMGQLCVLKGHKEADFAICDTSSLCLLPSSDLADHCRDTDFVVSTISFETNSPIYSPELNIELLSKITYKNFINKEFAGQDNFPLLYYR